MNPNPVGQVCAHNAPEVEKNAIQSAPGRRENSEKLEKHLPVLVLQQPPGNHATESLELPLSLSLSDSPLSLPTYYSRPLACLLACRLSLEGNSRFSSRGLPRLCSGEAGRFVSWSWEEGR